MLRDAAKEIPEACLASFNSVAPDLAFTVGDSAEGLERMLRSAGLVEELDKPSGGFFRWLTGRA